MSGKILAIDFGTKKFGLAISDENAEYARPLPLMFVKNDTDALEKLSKIINEQNPSEILFGIPYNEDGTHSPFSLRVEKFSEDVKKLFSNIPLETIDESMTSAIARDNAKKMKYKKSNIDGEAARIMLQEYLDIKNY